eukprot:6490789-Amphidinium_carterae.2
MTIILSLQTRNRTLDSHKFATPIGCSQGSLPAKHLLVKSTVLVWVSAQSLQLVDCTHVASAWEFVVTHAIPQCESHTDVPKARLARKALQPQVVDMWMDVPTLVTDSPVESLMFTNSNSCGLLPYEKREGALSCNVLPESHANWARRVAMLAAGHHIHHCPLVKPHGALHVLACWKSLRMSCITAEHTPLQTRKKWKKCQPYCQLCPNKDCHGLFVEHLNTTKYQRCVNAIAWGGQVLEQTVDVWSWFIVVMSQRVVKII